MSVRAVILKSILAGVTVMATSSGAWADDHGGDQKPHGRDHKPKEWSAELGAAVMFKPDYEGSDDYGVMAVPLVKLSWRDRVWVTTMGGPGIFARPLAMKNFTADIGVRYSGGRDEDNNDALDGLGDLDVGAIGVGKLSYKMGPIRTSVQLDYDLGGDRDGATVTLNANYRTKLKLLDQKIMFSAGPYMTWANDDYMSNTFGISTTQAANSTVGLSRFDAGAGIKDVGVKAMFGYAISENLSAMTFAGYSRLLGDAADSPLVADQGSENQAKIGFGIKYNW